MGKLSFVAAMSLGRSPSQRRLLRGFAACFRSVTRCARCFVHNFRKPGGKHYRGGGGGLNTVHNARSFAIDADQPLLLSLEEFNPKTKVAAKTAIFESPHAGAVQAD